MRSLVFYFSFPRTYFFMISVDASPGICRDICCFQFSILGVDVYLQLLVFVSVRDALWKCFRITVNFCFIANDTKQVVLTSRLSAKNFCLTFLLFLRLSSQPFSDPSSSRSSFECWWNFFLDLCCHVLVISEALELFGFFPGNRLIE